MKIKGSNVTELKIISNTSVDYVLECVKNLIKSNLDNYSLNTLEIKHFCSFCEDQLVEETIVDLNNNVIVKNKDYSCNVGNQGISKESISTEKLKYSNKITNNEIRMYIDKEDSLQLKYLTLSIGEFIKIPLSEFYFAEEYELYGKKIYSEVEDDDIIKIYITATKKGVNIYFENIAERNYKRILTTIKLR